MHRIGYARAYRPLDPEREYKGLGPLTPDEIRWLAKQTPTVRTRWFASIYGPRISTYARAQYKELSKVYDYVAT